MHMKSLAYAVPDRPLLRLVPCAPAQSFNQTQTMVLDKLWLGISGAQ